MYRYSQKNHNFAKLRVLPNFLPQLGNIFIQIYPTFIF